MILRFPKRDMSEDGMTLPPQVRVGKSAYWIQFDPKGQDWPKFLVDLLEKLSLKNSHLTDE